MQNYNLKISNFLVWQYSETQLCNYLLSKTITSICSESVELILKWYKDVFNSKASSEDSSRQELIAFYTRMLLVENKYEQYLEFWIEKHGRNILSDIDDFLSLKTDTQFVNQYG